MHILLLNPMRGRYEELVPVARAHTREALDAFLASEKVDTYTEKDANDWGPASLRKSFRKGGPLEYFNPPDRNECYQRASLDEWLANTTRAYEERGMTVPCVD